jgi:hypothetical protein
MSVDHIVIALIGVIVCGVLMLLAIPNDEE